MFISCPKCETTFSLPDELFKPGKKARCSSCGFVFPMQAPKEGDPAPAPEPAKTGKTESAQPANAQKEPFYKKHRKSLAIGAAAFLLLFLSYGGYLIISSFVGSSDPAQTASSGAQPGGRSAAPMTEADLEHQRLINTISLEDIRQFQVANTKIGKLLVIQGVAVNISDTNKDFIAIEARILNANGQVTGQPVQQLCGVSLTLFQLQSLSSDELKATIDNRISILTNNTNIAPGGRVPFVVIFPTPPPDSRKFEVRVISVQESAV